MSRLEIVHEYRDGPATKHDGHSAWVAEAAEWLLMGLQRTTRETR
jgi:hypothetical protein